MKHRFLLALVLAVFATATGIPGAARAAETVASIDTGDGPGFFQVDVQLPASTPQGRLIIRPKVEKGNLRLVRAALQGEKEAEAEGEEAGPAGRTVTVTGRYGKPGAARVVLLGRAARDAGTGLEPLAAISFTIPKGENRNPAVRQEWGRQQRLALAAVDPFSEEVFTRYWNGVASKKYGLPSETASDFRPFRGQAPDLYSVFTGAAAIQESLQLEALGSRRRTGKSEGPPAPPVPVAALAGPAVKSHPFTEMLKGKTPAVDPLAAFIPADNYAVLFTDFRKEQELADLMEEWGGNLLREMETGARDFGVRTKLTRRLCLEESLLTRLFGDRVIGAMAFTGSDPFLREGTDFTVLFALKDRKAFIKQVEKRFREAEARGAARKTVKTGTAGISGVATPDGRVSSYLLVMEDTAAVSTSPAALARIAAAAAGTIPRLADAGDFRYMRTIYPAGDEKEDIFIYLSDSHIRSLVSPAAKIGEARRVRCTGTMGLIGNARLWFKAENGREPTLEELVAGGYLAAPPECPDHGVYHIDGTSGEVSCSHHNLPGYLTPVRELAPETVTADEAAEYRTFREDYDRYWRQFFDPIGIRVKMGRTIRIETCILPLIENSWYDGLVAFSGRTAGDLSESDRLPRTVASLRGHMAPEVLQESGFLKALRTRDPDYLNWLGNELSLNLCDGQFLFSVDHGGAAGLGLFGQGMGRSLEPVAFGFIASALNLPTYLTLSVTDPAAAEKGLPQLFRALEPEYSRGDGPAVETYAVEEYRGTKLHVATFRIFMLKLRLYTAVVGDRLTVASRKDILTDLIDQQADGKSPQARNPGNLELSLYRSAFRQLAEPVALGWQEDLRHGCAKNLPLTGILLKGLELSGDDLAAATESLRGYRPYCPSGGKYGIDADGAVSCSIHGTRWHPRQPSAGDESSPTVKLVNSLEKVNARLSFTPEGLMTTVEIVRKGSAE